MIWQFPWLLLLLLGLPLLWLLPQRGTGTPLWVANAPLSSNQRQRPWLSRLVLIVSLAALVLALAKPVKLGPPVPVKETGRDLMLAIDLSSSMDAMDMAVGDYIYNRISIVKEVVARFIDGRQGDRMGLVLFADHAYVQAPITRDLDTVSQWVQSAELASIGSNTAIGEGIAISARQLSALDNEQKVLILLSDGANNAGDVSPIAAAQWAQNQGVRIYTIGINGFLGGADNQTLYQVARQTGGQFFSAEDAYELSRIYQEIDRLEPIERAAEPVRLTMDLYYWPLGVAIFGLLVVIVLRGRQQ